VTRLVRALWRARWRRGRRRASRNGGALAYLGDFLHSSQYVSAESMRLVESTDLHVRDHLCRATRLATRRGRSSSSRAPALTIVALSLFAEPGEERLAVTESMGRHGSMRRAGVPFALEGGLACWLGLSCAVAGPWGPAEQQGAAAINKVRTSFAILRELGWVCGWFCGCWAWAVVGLVVVAGEQRWSVGVVGRRWSSVWVVFASSDGSQLTHLPPPPGARL
jgi:hypothetical protein